MRHLGAASILGTSTAKHPVKKPPAHRRSLRRRLFAGQPLLPEYIAARLPALHFLEAFTIDQRLQEVWVARPEARWQELCQIAWAFCLHLKTSVHHALLLGAITAVTVPQFSCYLPDSGTARRARV